MLNKIIFFVTIFSVAIYGTEWKYLESESFKSRYVLAADFMKDMDFVVEIGGYKTPIVDFLPDSVAAISIDPKSESRKYGNKMVISDYYVDNSIIPQEKSYGVVLLGMDLENLEGKAWLELLNLIRGAEKVVIGYPIDWMPSKKQHDKILNSVPLRLSKKILLDLSGNNMGDMSNSYPPRVKRIQYYYSK